MSVADSKPIDLDILAVTKFGVAPYTERTVNVMFRVAISAIVATIHPQLLALKLQGPNQQAQKAVGTLCVWS